MFDACCCLFVPACVVAEYLNRYPYKAELKSEMSSNPVCLISGNPGPGAVELQRHDADEKCLEILPGDSIDS